MDLTSSGKVLKFWIIIFFGLNLFSDPIDCGCPDSCFCIHREGRLNTDCTNASLTRLPGPIPERSMILILNQNDFTRLVEPDAFKIIKATHINELYLSHCQIQEIQATVWNGLTNLGRLVLSSNRIQNLKSNPFQGLQALKFLDLSQNELVSVNSGWFGGLVLLEEINLSFNKINYIFDDAFTGLLNLKRIYLNNNQLDKISPDAFIVLPYLQILTLKSNHWLCDCHLRNFIKWEHGKYKTDPPQCANPERVAGKAWNALNFDDFACGPTVEPKINNPINAEPGSDVKFSCTIKSDPEPTIAWEFRSNTKKQPLPEPQNDRITLEKRQINSEKSEFQSILSISKIDVDDAGQYHCKASISIDEDYVVFTLNVKNFSNVAVDGMTTRYAGGENRVNGPAPVAVSGGGRRTQVISGLTHDWMIIIFIIIGAILVILLLIIALACYRRKQNTWATSSYYMQMNGNGYKYLTANGSHKYNNGMGNKTDVLMDPSSCDHGFTPLFETSPAHVAALEKQTLDRKRRAEGLSPYSPGSHAPYVPVTGAMIQDDSGYLDATDVNSQASSRRNNYATLPAPKRPPSNAESERSSPNSLSTDKRRHSLPGSKAPLAQSDEPDQEKGGVTNNGLALRETAL